MLLVGKTSPEGAHPWSSGQGGGSSWLARGMRASPSPVQPLRLQASLVKETGVRECYCQGEGTGA